MTDPLEELLRTTGRRPTVPAERAERVAAAVRAHWQAEVRRRARRRKAWTAGGLAAAALITVTVALVARRPQASSLGTAARVEVVTALPGRPSGLRAGDALAAGTELVTDQTGRLALRMGSGHSVRLDAGTRVRLLSDRLIALDVGAVYVDSRGPAGASTLALGIRTPLGEIRDIGTQFEVRCAAGSLRMRVREGSIALDGAGGTLEVGPGQEVVLGEGGRIARRASLGAPVDWHWVGEITPMLALEGHSLQEFLDWIARERGLRLRFARPETERTAPTIILNGSIEGMTLDQALESVLPTCRLSHRLEGDALLVE